MPTGDVCIGASVEAGLGVVEGVGEIAIKPAVSLLFTGVAIGVGCRPLKETSDVGGDAAKTGSGLLSSIAPLNMPLAITEEPPPAITIVATINNTGMDIKRRELVDLGGLNN